MPSPFVIQQQRFKPIDAKRLSANSKNITRSINALGQSRKSDVKGNSIEQIIKEEKAKKTDNKKKKEGKSNRNKKNKEKKIELMDKNKMKF